MINAKEIKCIVWDLDNTIWDGILLEDGAVALKEGIADVIEELDSRGILHSIASRNDYNHAIEKLKEFDLHQYFLYPEINWNSKSHNISNIQANLNIGIDSILFIDDQPFELDEVKSVHSEINLIDASCYRELISRPALRPAFITSDAARRRLMYIEDSHRKKAEDEYKGPMEVFLKSLSMEFSISHATEDDLKRAEELTIRTNQLNATGKTYDYNELNYFRISSKHKLLICELTDKYGSYGKIGLALIEMGEDHWHLKLLLMSCRVISRGVGTVLLSYVMKEANAQRKKLLADFKKTDRNKMMYISYKFANFKEISSDEEGNILFENDLTIIQEYPSYIKINLETVKEAKVLNP